MINKRLIQFVPESKKAIALQVLYQWLTLICNILLMGGISYLFYQLYIQKISIYTFLYFPLFILLIYFRSLFSKLSIQASYRSSHLIKKRFRRFIMEKLIQLEGHYLNETSTAQWVQLSTEGVEQLESYFGAYLPQFFFAMLAPLTLFIFIAPLSFKPAFALLICVPLIPISIALVQTFAKKLLSKYWGQYSALGDRFLENLQGLTTLKIYQSDEFFHQQMNEEAEKFRKITMKVLTMQLNSITIMDLVAYGGTALGIFLALKEYQNGSISIFVFLFILFLCADFFLPMRTLGSYFHIAMNGLAASDKIFQLVDLKIPTSANQELKGNHFEIDIHNLNFSYENKKILNHINFNIKPFTFNAIVGESGSGKTTLAKLIQKSLVPHENEIMIQHLDICSLSSTSLNQHIVTVGFDAYLFSGCVRDQLGMVKKASDEEYIQVLKQVRLWDFLQKEKGLDTVLLEGGNNLSGGQRQRLALACALLHDAEIYIFDEATSNIDAESENEIMEIIRELAQRKTVLLITHRLANAIGANQILVLQEGNCMGCGTHEQLLDQCPTYQNLWYTQQELEGNYEAI